MDIEGETVAGWIDQQNFLGRIHLMNKFLNLAHVEAKIKHNRTLPQYTAWKEQVETRVRTVDPSAAVDKLNMWINFDYIFYNNFPVDLTAYLAQQHSVDTQWITLDFWSLKEYFQSMLANLEQLHAVDYIHSDVKPNQYLFAQDYSCSTPGCMLPTRLIDFGIYV